MGEVIDWKANPQKSSKLHWTFDPTSLPRINSIDFYCQKILTSSSHLNKLNFSGSTILSERKKRKPHEPCCVQVLGKNIFVSYSGGEGMEIYDSKLNPIKGGTSAGVSTYLQLIGSHLVIERSSLNTPNTRKIYVYDLGNNNNNQKSEKS